MALEHILAALAARSRTAEQNAAIEAERREAQQAARREWLRSVCQTSGTSVKSRMKKESSYR